jgi:hypothetical protein
MKKFNVLFVVIFLASISLLLQAEENKKGFSYPRGILEFPDISSPGDQNFERLQTHTVTPFMTLEENFSEGIQHFKTPQSRENVLQEDPSGKDPGIASHTLVQDFQGINNTGWYPPDPVIATGPNHVVVVVNSHWSAYTKAGSLATGPTSLSNFFSSVDPPGDFVFDPKVIYDHYRDRFIILAPATNFSDSAAYMVAASNSSDPTGSWWFYSLDATLDDTTQSSNWADFPGLGFDEEALYITSNQYAFSGGFQYAKLRIVHIDSLYSGAPAVWVDFWDMRNQFGNRIFTLKPAHTFNGSGDPEYLLNTRPGGTNYVNLWSVTDPSGTPTLTREADLIIRNYSAPPNAEQMGSGTRIHTGDSRTHDIMARDGILYAAFTESEDWGSGGTESAIRFLKIDAVSEVVLEDITFGSNNLYYFYPNVYADELGDVVMVYNRSGTSEYVGVHFTAKLVSSNIWEASQLLKAGEAPYVRLDGFNRNRWGDYSGAALDPTGATPRSIWIYGEYARPSNQWRTWIGEVSFPIVHDGLALSLDAPGDTVFTDSTYNVQAKVRNSGNVTETFDVIATINGYTDTVQVINLDPGDSTQVNFTSWTVPSTDSTTYTMTVCTDVASDADTTNDCIGKSIFAFTTYHDGGVISVNAPGDTVFTDSTYNVQAKVQNFGNMTESFDVFATINGYNDTIAVMNLAPGDSTQVNFTPWTVPSPDSTNYILNICTEVSGDGDSTNDCDAKSIYALTYRFHDIGVTGLPSPQDTVFTDSTYTAEAWIQNFGNLITSSIEVIVTINGYTDTVIVSSLSPGDSNLVTFQNWTVPSLDSTSYLFSVCTDVGGDEDTTNNCEAKSIFAYNPVGIEENSEFGVRNAEFRLFQNHPNPFNKLTAISYKLQAPSHTTLQIYDLAGRLVETLVDEVQEPGVYQLPITSHQLPGSGVYFYRIVAGDFKSMKKMTFLR